MNPSPPSARSWGRPRRFGRYELLGVLGSGATAVVYRARADSGGEDVALKVLAPDLTQHPDWSRRFRREALLLQQLNHPNIVRCLDQGEADGSLFMAQEISTGRSLREWMGRRVSSRSEAWVGCQAAAGLAAAHELGLAHRDLKPENLMISREGALKILDFGLARPTEQAATVDLPTTLELVTRDDAPLGTPRYFSPEQVRGTQVGSSTDVFSLGICLFELAAARHPFDAPFVQQVVESIVDRPAPDLARWRNDLPPEIHSLIQSMLAKEPEKRPLAQEVGRVLRPLSEA